MFFLFCLLHCWKKNVWSDCILEFCLHLLSVMCTEREHHGIKMMMGLLTFSHVISRWFYAKRTDTSRNCHNASGIWSTAHLLNNFNFIVFNFCIWLKEIYIIQLLYSFLPCNERMLLYNIWMYRNSIGSSCRSVNNCVTHILSLCVDMKWSCRNYKKKPLFLWSPRSDRKT